ncbi:MAG: hypothetical protein QOC81_3808 [Thermoanaerobaculia bacterium]|nr:hypothetical protein [Thermoanaerobaculia bacterium]
MSSTKLLRLVLPLLFCLAASGLYAQVRNDDSTVIVSGDRPGGNLYSKPLLLPEVPAGQFDLRQNQCETACARNGGCVAWTYIKSNSAIASGKCWLKSSITPLVSCPFCVSGTIGAPDTNRPGGDYRHFDHIGTGVRARTVNASQCKAACLREAQCQAWTWVLPDRGQGPNGNCWLKNEVPPAVPNACCISGSVSTTIIR